MATTRSVVLKARPTVITPDCFEIVDIEVPRLNEGEVLVQAASLIMDPIVRTRLLVDTYMPAIEPGEVVKGLGVATVLESSHPDVQKGEVVFGWVNWQEQTVCQVFPGHGFFGPPYVHPLRGLSADSPLFAYGTAICAAWVGLIEIGALRPGETALVSGASGGVGTIAGQMIKRLGGTAVGITSTNAKADYLQSIGYDKTVLYTEPALPRQIRRACSPVSVFLDTAGGPILDAGISWLSQNAHVALCGAAGTYGSSERHRFKYLDRLIYTRSSMHGFVVGDYGSSLDRMMAQVAAWDQEKPFAVPVSTFEGLEGAPHALVELFSTERTARPWVIMPEAGV